MYWSFRKGSQCRGCGGAVGAFGVDGDKDFLYSPVGQALIQGIQADLGMDRQQAWQYTMLVMEELKMRSRVVEEPVAGGYVEVSYDINTAAAPLSRRTEINGCFWIV